MARRRSVARHRQRQALAAIHERLVQEYGTPRPRRCLPPLDELVLTILSQNTNDTNRDRAWERLRARFTDWGEVAEAPLEEVEEALRPGGLHRTKAKRIRAVLARVHELHGGYRLEALQELDTAEARRRLLAIKGIGEKSANCILLFSLGRPVFPADTHVHRILERVGVHRCRDLAATNRELQDELDEERAYPLHVNLIRHGRQVCHARKPECWRCCLQDLCGWPHKRTDPASAG